MPANPERMRPTELMYNPTVQYVNRVVETEAQLVFNEKDELMKKKANKFLLNGIKIPEKRESA